MLSTFSYVHWLIFISFLVNYLKSLFSQSFYWNDFFIDFHELLMYYGHESFLET